MTIKFLANYGPYGIGQTVTLSTAEENSLVAQRFATTDLTGGTPYVAPAGPNQINASRAAVSSDSGLDPLDDVATSAITYTLNSLITEALRIRQRSAGAVTVVSDASAEMTGAGGTVITSLATTGIGSMILIEPLDLTVTPRKYLVIKGGA